MQGNKSKIWLSIAIYLKMICLITSQLQGVLLVLQLEQNVPRTVCENNQSPYTAKFKGSASVNPQRDEGITTQGDSNIFRSYQPRRSNYSYAKSTKAFATSWSRTTRFAFFDGIVPSTPKQDVQDTLSKFVFLGKKQQVKEHSSRLSQQGRTKDPGQSGMI